MHINNLTISCHLSHGFSPNKARRCASTECAHSLLLLRSAARLSPGGAVKVVPHRPPCINRLRDRPRRPFTCAPLRSEPLRFVHHSGAALKCSARSACARVRCCEPVKVGLIFKSVMGPSLPAPRFSCGICRVRGGFGDVNLDPGNLK